MIARQLFQTCKDPARIPIEFEPLVARWRGYCAANGFRHQLFGDADMDAFVREEDPQGYALYQSLETIVEKADYWRYLVVLRRGGYYADIDCAPQPALLRLAQPRLRPMVQVEHDRWLRFTRSFCQLPEIAQFFFAFPAGSPVLGEVVEEAKRRMAARPYRHLGRVQEILFTTGPGGFGSVLMKHRREVD